MARREQIAATVCPLCLSVCDPADLINVEVESAIPGGPRTMQICRWCALATSLAFKRFSDEWEGAAQTAEPEPVEHPNGQDVSPLEKSTKLIDDE